jgi:hypothetical protein
MRKLKLDPEALRVETFATRPSAAARPGTVRAHATLDFDCEPTGIHYDSCDVSCWWMCFPTGNDPSCAC